MLLQSQAKNGPVIQRFCSAKGKKVKKKAGGGRKMSQSQLETLSENS